MIALPYYVYVTTGSTLATAGMTAAELAPAILLSSFTGVLADGGTASASWSSPTCSRPSSSRSLLLVGEGWLWVVYVVAALQSTAAAFSQPAESALLPTLVPVEQLVQANALNALNNRLGRFVGVPLGAALLSWWGLDAVVVVDAVTFLVAAALIAPITTPARAADPDGVPEEPHFWREWTAGLRVVRHDRTIAVLFVVFGLMTFGGTMLDPLYVPWIRDVLDEGVEVVAVITMTHSVAGIVGSLLVGTWGSRFSARTLMGWGSVIAGVLLLVKFNVPVLWLTLALSAIGGGDRRRLLGRRGDAGPGTDARARPGPRLRLAPGLHLAGQPARRGGRRRARRADVGARRDQRRRGPGHRRGGRRAARHPRG